MTILAQQNRVHHAISDLMNILGKEIKLLKTREEQFEKLHNIVIKCKGEQMDALLEEMTTSRQEQAELDSELDYMRDTIAGILNIPSRDTTLREIAKKVGGKDGEKLITLRQQLIVLAERLKTQHLNTAVLLAEMSRINKELINSMIPDSERRNRDGDERPIGALRIAHAGT